MVSTPSAPQQRSTTLAPVSPQQPCVDAQSAKSPETQKVQSVRWADLEDDDEGKEVLSLWNQQSYAAGQEEDEKSDFLCQPCEVSLQAVGEKQESTQSSSGASSSTAPPDPRAAEQSASEEFGEAFTQVRPATH